MPVGQYVVVVVLRGVGLEELGGCVNVGVELFLCRGLLELNAHLYPGPMG